MSQYDFGTIDPNTKSGTALATDLNSWRNALHSTHGGSSAPSYITAGMLWVDTTSANYELKMYDGAQSITVAVIDATNNVARVAVDSAETSYITSTTAGQIQHVIASSAKMTVNSTGVGIGTSSPEAPLHVVGGDVIIQEANSGAGTGPNLFLRRTSTTPEDDDYLGAITFQGVNDALAEEIYARIIVQATDVSDATEDGSLTFWTTAGGALAERARIFGGSLLIAKTSTGVNIVGIEASGTGLFRATRDGGECIEVNRLTDDGIIARFRQDGTTVGSIGNNGDNIYIAGADSGILFGINAGILPTNSSGATVDNSKDIGALSSRWDDIYATNGTIQTSDRNEKQDIRDITEAETRVAQACKGLLKAYRWKDAVAEKGEEARIHFGIIAQDLQDAFAAEGLDAGRYAMFIHSTWTDEETGEERSRMGVRYSELLAFIIAVL
jgi:hypothetical protein